MPTENVREMSDIVLQRSLEYWVGHANDFDTMGEALVEAHEHILERQTEIARRNSRPKPDPVLPAHLVKLGFGDMALCPGTLHGVPAVFLEPVDPTAPVGHRSPYREELQPGSTAITFDTARSMTVLYEMLGRLIEPGRREEVLTLLDRVQDLEKAAGDLLAFARRYDAVASNCPEMQALGALLSPSTREA